MSIPIPLPTSIPPSINIEVEDLTVQNIESFRPGRTV